MSSRWKGTHAARRAQDFPLRDDGQAEAREMPDEVAEVAEEQVAGLVVLLTGVVVRPVMQRKMGHESRWCNKNGASAAIHGDAEYVYALRLMPAFSLYNTGGWPARWRMSLGDEHIATLGDLGWLAGAVEDGHIATLGGLDVSLSSSFHFSGGPLEYGPGRGVGGLIRRGARAPRIGAGRCQGA